MPPERRRLRLIPFISIHPGICSQCVRRRCFNKSASCVSGRCVWEPVAYHRGSILQLVFTIGRTWRTERRSGLHTKLRRPCEPPARVHAARRASLAGQSWGLFCRAAIMSVCHRLAQRLAGIDRGGGAKLDCRRARTQKLTRLSARCSASMSDPLSVLQGCLIGVTAGNGFPWSLGKAAISPLPTEGEILKQ